MKVPDPIALARKLWPKVRFYREQKQVIYSLLENDETYVPAGNMLGKDFVAGFLVLYWFLTRHPCRIVTTSAKDDHLRVLWGEVGRFIQDSKVALLEEDGGPLISNHQKLHKVVNGERCPLSYAIGLVASTDSIAAMQGHHIAKTGDGIPRTLFISDESSSVCHEYYEMASTWANRILILGNTWPCENFFKKGVQGGDIPRKSGVGFHKKIVRIRAVDSPNIRYALAEQEQGKEVSGRMLLPGVKDWEEYQKNLELWDEIQKCVSLDAEFYEGEEVKMYPPEWLNRCKEEADALKRKGTLRRAKAIGVDPAEGGDKTCLTAVDTLGIIEQVAQKTPDTSIIPGWIISFMRKHRVDAENVLIDRGGGGKEHADTLRQKGYAVRTLAFGETVKADLQKGYSVHKTYDKRVDEREKRYSFKNVRAQIAWELRKRISGKYGKRFAIPKDYSELIRQLSAIPLQYDGEGRLWLPPKKSPERAPGTQSLQKLLGCSPDEFDSTSLAVFALVYKPPKNRAGTL